MHDADVAREVVAGLDDAGDGIDRGRSAPGGRASAHGFHLSRQARVARGATEPEQRVIRCALVTCILVVAFHELGRAQGNPTRVASVVADFELNDRAVEVDGIVSHRVVEGAETVFVGFHVHEARLIELGRRIFAHGLIVVFPSLLRGGLSLFDGALLDVQLDVLQTEEIGQRVIDERAGGGHARGGAVQRHVALGVKAVEHVGARRAQVAVRRLVEQGFVRRVDDLLRKARAEFRNEEVAAGVLAVQAPRIVLITAATELDRGLRQQRHVVAAARDAHVRGEGDGHERLQRLLGGDEALARRVAIVLAHLVVNTTVVVVGRIGNLAALHAGQLGGLGRHRLVIGSRAVGSSLVGDPLLQQSALLHFVDVGEAHLVQVVVFRIRPVRRIVNENATLVNLAPERTLLAAGSRICGIVANDLVFFFDVLPRHQVFAGDALAVVVSVHDVEVVIDFVDERLRAGFGGVLGCHAVDHVVVAVVQHVLRDGRVVRFPGEVAHQEGNAPGKIGVVRVLLGGGVQVMSRDTIGIGGRAARKATVGFT